MPYHLNWTTLGLELTAYGIVTLEDVVETQGKFYSDPRSEKVKYVIWNSLGADKIDMNDTGYLHPAGNDVGAAHTVKNLRVALVATDPMMAGLCVQYQALLRRHNTGWHVEVFEDIQNAKDWLLSSLAVSHL